MVNVLNQPPAGYEVACFQIKKQDYSFVHNGMTQPAGGVYSLMKPAGGFSREDPDPLHA